MADRQLQNILSSGEVTNVQVGGATVADALLTRAELDAEYLTNDGSNVATNIKFDPQSSTPTYTEGQEYYDLITGTKRIQGPFSDVEIAVGHGQHMHVENNSGALIEKGSAVRQNGVIAGKIQVVKAIADTFDNARMIGIAAHDIADGAEGAAQTFGEIRTLDTSAFSVGVPLYLSDTVAGTFTSIAPDIISRIGGVTVSDLTNGILFVYIINNKNLPQVVGGMQGQNTPVYAVTGVAQDIVDYTTSESIVVTTDILNGTVTLPNDGAYRMHFTASISFPSATSTRAVTFEFYDQTNTAILFSYVKNIPRDATDDGLGFSFPINGLANDIYKMRIYASASFNVTFNDVSFDVESVNIR